MSSGQAGSHQRSTGKGIIKTAPKAAAPPVAARAQSQAHNKKLLANELPKLPTDAERVLQIMTDCVQLWLYFEVPCVVLAAPKKFVETLLKKEDLSVRVAVSEQLELVDRSLKSRMHIAVPWLLHGQLNFHSGHEQHEKMDVRSTSICS